MFDNLACDVTLTHKGPPTNEEIIDNMVPVYVKFINCCIKTGTGVIGSVGLTMTNSLPVNKVDELALKSVRNGISLNQIKIFKVKK